MQMLQGLIAATFLAAPVPATTDWWRVASTGNATNYVDLDATQPNGAWVRTDQVMIYRVASPERRAKRIDTVTEYECSRGLIRYRRLRSFDAANTLLNDMIDPDGLTEHPADPLSLGGKTLDFVCGNDRAGAVRVADPLTDRF